ncbi:MAG: HEAT repeat domain-containing protein [Planctomycetota bacterium]
MLTPPRSLVLVLFVLFSLQTGTDACVDEQRACLVASVSHGTDEVDGDADGEAAADSAITEAGEALRKAARQYGSRPKDATAREDNYRACEDLFQEIIDRFPGTPEAQEALFYRSQCQRALERPKEALEGFDLFLDLGTDHARTPDVLHYKGHAEQDLLLWEASLITFRRVYEEYPQAQAVAACLYDAGLTCRELRLFDDGRKLWQRVIDEHPSSNYAKRARNDMETQRHPRIRLDELHREYIAALTVWKKAAFKEKANELKGVKKALDKMGDVRCVESEQFFQRLIRKEKGDLRAAAVKPSLKVSGAKVAESLLKLLHQAPQKMQLEILDNMKRRHLAKSKLKVLDGWIEAQQPKVRQAAIKMLGRVGSFAATRLLIRGYQDGKDLPAAVDKANQLVLRGLRSVRDDEALSYLSTSIATSPRTPTALRIGVARALGYCQSLQVVPSLRQLLRDREPRVVAAAVESLGRLGAEGSEEDLLAVLKRSQAPDVQQATIRALKRMDPTVASDELLRLSRSPDVAVRTLCMQAFAKIESEAVFQRILEALADPAWQVRRAALGVAGRYARRDLVDVLIERMAQEDGVLLPQVVRLLILITGADLGPDPLDWADYWKKTREQFAEKAREDDGKGRSFVQKANPDKATPSYFGVEIISKKLAFVVDVSGSMSGKVVVAREGGGEKETTKIDLAKQELINAIEALRPKTRFNILPFNGKYREFVKKLVPVSKRVKAQAVRFAKGLAPGGATNIYDSLEHVVQRGEVDTIYLLSDGSPSAGKHTDGAIIWKRSGASTRPVR